jgi:hypothetical protein
MPPSMLRCLVRVAAVPGVLFLGACRTPPAPLPPPVLVSPARPPSPPAPVLPAGVSISPPLIGDTTGAFVQSRRGERTFPHNAIGANLAFTANLRMPKLEAVDLPGDGYQLRLRFSNASETPLYVSFYCIYDGETKATRSVRHVEFPVNTFRDIALDLEGDVSRKLNIRASALPIAGQ